MAVVPLTDIQFAAERIADSVIHSPLLRLPVDDAPWQIYLKLENLQPIGSFKLRGAGNAIQLADAKALTGGVWTASAGNMAQGVAWHARRLGIPCHVVVPDHAPQTKLNAIERLGGKIIPVPFASWWDTLVSGEFAGLDGLFIHPVSDPAVIAGNGTIGLEILRDLPDVAAVVIPYGGGGLCAGIASAIRAIKPAARIYAAEVATAAPLAASLRAGEPTEIAYTPSFVDGIGSSTVLPEMWELARSLLDGSLVASLDEVRAAIRILARRARVIAEGAGAAGVAAALAGGAGGGKVVCVVSGGNIDLATLAEILQTG
ncbi:MAG: pyridoxal-phosphate dependent enzyme [Chloroflexi bacterium]|nr:pyridoxal-phosphate dependent enzyme [Chloroflexota bacterium]MCY4248719.1 pyridoxal-phosphate dependent enzyme [Chloroflexota bacterium]